MHGGLLLLASASGATLVVLELLPFGKLQTAARSAPHPAGATGYHQVEVEVA